jgi:hypothetical protein
MAEPDTITETLYDADILLWSQPQAELLRRRASNALAAGCRRRDRRGLPAAGAGHLPGDARGAA